MQYRLASLLALMISMSPVLAQQGEGKLSDAERARRDADKVFSFIKFHTVKPATPPAPAAKPTPPRAAAPSPALSRSAGSPAPTAQLALAAGGPASSLGGAASESEAAPPPSAATVTLPLPSEAATPVAAAVETVEEELPLKLIAYTAPEMSGAVLAAMNSNQVVVPVRFTVQPDGRVSAAQSMGNAPRRVAQAAVRAVQQWRFDPLPAQREVDVEIAFKAAE